MSSTAWLSVMALLLTSATSVVALLREKRDESTSEHKLRRRLKPVLFALTAVGLVLGIFTVRSSDKANKEATQKHLREQQELQAKLDTSLQAQQYARSQLDSITGMVRKFTETDKSPAAKRLAAIVNETVGKKSPATTPHVIKVQSMDGGNFYAAHKLNCVPDAAVVQMTSLGSIVLQSPKGWDDKNLYLTASDGKLTADVLVWCETNAAPPIHRSETFVTFLVFNPGNRQHPLVCSVDLMKVALCTQLSQAISRNLPPDESSWRRFFSIAIQHYLISLVKYAGSGYGMHSESNGIIFKQIPAIDIPDSETFEVSQVCTLSETDRSLLTQDLSLSNSIILPKLSRCSLMSTNLGASVLRFERPNYYQLDFDVRVMMQGQKGQVPRGFKVPFADKSQLLTYYIEITSNLTVNRINDRAFAPDEYVRWGEKLFESVKGKMDEPSEPPEIEYGKSAGR